MENKKWPLRLVDGAETGYGFSTCACTWTITPRS